MTLLLVHAATTWFMVGLIWIVQTVHYPLFALVGETEFVKFERQHTRRIGALLAIPAGLEVVTAAAMLWERPDEVGIGLVLVAGVALASIWVITALTQAPIHTHLSSGFDAGSIGTLVRTNWWRTSLWTGRGLLVLAMVIIATA